MGTGLERPKRELSVKKRKSQESPGQGDPFCSVSQREWSQRDRSAVSSGEAQRNKRQEPVVRGKVSPRRSCLQV